MTTPANITVKQKTGHWFVLDDDKVFLAGPFAEQSAAERWIAGYSLPNAFKLPLQEQIKVEVSGDGSVVITQSDTTGERDNAISLAGRHNVDAFIALLTRAMEVVQ